MNKIIKRVPLPTAGLMLGTFALGNLLQSYGEGLRTACGILGAFLLVLVLLKIFIYPNDFKEDMKNPIMASVFGTFSMSLMLFAGYLKPLIGPNAAYLWFLAIGIHLGIIVFFTLRFIFKFDLKKVFASYYIVYVGIAVAGITAPTFERLDLGAMSFYFGFVSLILLLILVTARYLKFKEIPNPAKPVICIYAAPVSLCIAAYIQSVSPKSKEFVLGLLALATIIYVFALFKALVYMKLPFFPSFASFTFPFVISAIASKQTMAMLKKMEAPIPALKYLVLFETFIAVIFVAFTFYKFMEHIFIKKEA